MPVSVRITFSYELWQQLISEDRVCLFHGSCSENTIQVNVLVCVCKGSLSSCGFSEALYMAIGLQAGEKDIEEPESK